MDRQPQAYGAQKLWKPAWRAGHEIGRDQVARLMRTAGIQGVTRRRRVFATRPDPDALRAADLVKRNFAADRPNALWVTDLTYVPTRSKMPYVCFIVDAFSRMIVGWRAAAHMRTDMVLEALEMARAHRGTHRPRRPMVSTRPSASTAPTSPDGTTPGRWTSPSTSPTSSPFRFANYPIWP